MKRIFLYAYDRINFGDDLFIRTICRRYKNVKFYIWSYKYNKDVFKNIKNLIVIDKNSRPLKFLENKITPLFSRYYSFMEKRCDAIVYIGGSIFIEYDNWQQSFVWWDYEALNRKFYILGANFGPYKTEEYRNKLASIFNNVQDICFRDKYSYNLFSDVKKVRYAPDILFNYPCKTTETKKQIFISVIDCLSRESGLDKLCDKEENYINLLLKYIGIYVNKGYTVVLSSFCKIENDEKTINKILDRIDSNVERSVKIVNYNGENTDDVVSAMAESEFVIASRFHGTVLGFALDKPVLPIVYSDKTINILKDLSFKGRYIDIRKINSEPYVELDNNYDFQRIADIQQIRKDSEKHFEKLDKLLLE